MRQINILLLLTFIFSGCKEELDKLTHFKLSYTTKATIESGSPLGILPPILTPEIESNSQQEFENNNTRKELIEEIRLEEATITITSPDDMSFGFLNEIEVYILAEGLEKALLAYRKDIPDDVGNGLVLNTIEKDFQEYLKKDTYTIEFQYVTDQFISQDIETEIETRFFVNAKIFK